MRRTIISLLILCIMFTALSHCAAASGPFSVSGIVTDAGGNPVPGASVSLVNSYQKTEKTTTTNATGYFDFTNVRSDTGTVTIKVSYSDGTNNYTNPEPYKWYNAEGAQTISQEDTQLKGYTASASPAPGHFGEPINGGMDQLFWLMVAVIAGTAMAVVFLFILKKTVLR